MSYVTLQQGAAPSTPAASKASLYVDTTGRLHVLNSDGEDTTLVPSGPNMIRNGAFWFAQRQAPGTATTYSNTTGRAICADGWGITNENASATYQRTDTSAAYDTGLAARHYGNFLKTTSTGKLVVSQVIENVDCMQYRGQTVRLTVWMKQLVGAAPVVRLGLAQLTSAGTVDTMPATFISAFGANGVDPTLGTNVSYIAPKSGTTGDGCTISGNAASCTLSSSWQRFSVLFDVPTSMKNLVVLVFGNAQFAATNGFAISQCTLRVGASIPEWETVDVKTELLRVKRYYQKSFSVDTAPAQNAGVGTGALMCIAGKAAAVARAGVWYYTYPVEMRATPTITLYNPGAANAQARRVSGAAAADQTATATLNSNPHSFGVTCTGDAAGTVGDEIIVHFSSDAEL